MRQEKHTEKNYKSALRQLNALIKKGETIKTKEPVYIGVDIGTANVVSVAVTANGTPVGGIMTSAQVTKEGVIVDYLRAVEVVKEQVEWLGRNLDAEIRYAMSAVPPNTGIGNGKVTTNILESALLEVVGLIDEPEAASIVLGISDGGIVDIGGGTTGFSMLNDGKVEYSLDEATGGFQFDLVIAGRFKISVEEAERKKRSAKGQRELFPVIRPVMEKVASIIVSSFKESPPESLYLVGGSSIFHGFRELVEKETGIPTYLPDYPLLTTPYGIALACARFMSEKTFISEKRSE